MTATVTVRAAAAFLYETLDPNHPARRIASSKTMMCDPAQQAAMLMVCRHSLSCPSILTRSIRYDHKPTTDDTPANL
uniref:Uncharacterized protein n=1 Tax=Rhizobium leguminosarum bv. viciae TaxID=387 RepID=A0A0U3I5W6_RHILV|nr:hypothetical protein [Rhizobium leguminosarum bv. viciae]